MATQAPVRWRSDFDKFVVGLLGFVFVTFSNDFIDLRSCIEGLGEGFCADL
jgi:hypothetical protein